MFQGIMHQSRLKSIEAEYRPAISQRNSECAGLIFLNRYFMGVLAKLEPNHPLLDVGVREKIGRWGGFSFQESDGDRTARLQAAVVAGRSFSIPAFETKKQTQARLEQSQGTEEGQQFAEKWQEEWRKYNAACLQWKADQERGIVYAQPEFQMVRRESV